MDNAKISSVISNSSKTGKYLEQAAAEVAALNLDKGSAFLQEMTKAANELTENYNGIKDTIKLLADKRLDAFENLTSAILGKHYGTSMLSNFGKLEKFSRSANILNLDNNNSNLYNIISSIIVNTSLNRTGNKSLAELGSSVYRIFEELKDTLELGTGIDIDENGQVVGMNNIYNISGNQALKGSISFYTINRENLSDVNENTIGDYLTAYDGVIDEEISNDESRALIVKTALDLQNEIVLEQGNADSPYVIRNAEDMARTGMNTITLSSGSYYGLYSDIEISAEDMGTDSITLAGYDIHGNNHRLVLDGFKNISINATKIRNLNLVLKNKLDRDAIGRKINTAVNITLSYMPYTKYENSGDEKPFTLYFAPEEGELQGTANGNYETPLVSYNITLVKPVILNNDGNSQDLSSFYQDGIIPLTVNNQCRLNLTTVNSELGSLDYGVTNSQWVVSFFKTVCLFINRNNTIGKISYTIGENSKWYDIISGVIASGGAALNGIKVLDRNGDKYPAKTEDTPYKTFPKDQEFFGRYYVVVPDEDGYYYLKNISSRLDELSQTAKDEIFGRPLSIDEYNNFLVNDYSDYPVRYFISDKAIDSIEFGNYVFTYESIPVCIPGAEYSNIQSEDCHFSKFNPENGRAEAGDLDVFTEFIYYLALVSKAKYYSSNSVRLADTMISSDAAYLYSIIEKTLDKVTENKNKYYTESIDLLKSYEAIENTRYEKDPKYSTTHLTTLFSLKDQVSENLLAVSGLSDIEGAEEIVNYDELYENAATSLKMFNQECMNIIVALTQAVLEYNDYLIDCLNMFTQVSSEVRKDLKNFAESLNALRIDPGDTSFSFVGYASIRPYASWRDTLLKKYFAAPEEILVQIYLFQEVALNINSMSVYDVSDEAIIYKTAVNDAFDRIYRSALIQVSDKYTSSLKLEKELLDKYGVYVSSAPQYELLPSNLLQLIPELSDLNRMDISNMLLNVDNIDSDPSVKFIDLVLVKYLFSSQKGKTLSERYKLAQDELMKIDYDFKSLLVRYRLNNLYLQVADIAKNRQSALIGEIEADELTQAEQEERNIAELLAKYISVWLYKYYSTYSAYGSSLIYIGDDDLIKFLFGSDKKSYEILYEKKKNINDYLDGLGNDIQVIWQNFVSWICK